MVEVVFENFVNYLRSGNTDKLNIISFQQNQQHKINLSTQLIFYRILTKTVVQLNCKHRIQTNLTLSRWKKMKSMITRFACTLIINEKFADLMNKKLKSKIIRLSGTYSLQNQLRLGTRESYHILSSYTSDKI
ncbi:Hypothetical_protein [Hexamita inflata]|uniref:Hypothetical_protein n=1 Tax=Hexamita inflata TaxID=28002 RepID=A0AA86PYR2_9EUKA|nr:Hypothetical protein HINF_LOCUS36231 [Hexamita inflata]